MTWPSSTQESSLGLYQLTKDFATLVQYELCKYWILGEKKNTGQKCAIENCKDMLQTRAEHNFVLFFIDVNNASQAWHL